MCHCSDCRVVIGATSVAWVTVPVQFFITTQGEPALYKSSPNVLRTYCATCGTSLTYRHEQQSSGIDITTGSLDNPEQFPPTKDVFVNDKLPCLVVFEIRCVFCGGGTFEGDLIVDFLDFSFDLSAFGLQFAHRFIVNRPFRRRFAGHALIDRLEYVLRLLNQSQAALVLGVELSYFVGCLVQIVRSVAADIDANCYVFAHFLSLIGLIRCFSQVSCQYTGSQSGISKSKLSILQNSPFILFDIFP